MAACQDLGNDRCIRCSADGNISPDPVLFSPVPELFHTVEPDHCPLIQRDHTAWDHEPAAVPFACCRGIFSGRAQAACSLS